MDRACKEVCKDDQYEMFSYYISMNGIGDIRPLYEKALQTLKGRDFLDMGIRFAKYETEMGEIDRA